MPPKNQSKNVTIRGGVNIAPAVTPPKRTKKADTAKPPNQKTAASVPPEEPTE